jgi:hypothetical protein
MSCSLARCAPMQCSPQCPRCLPNGRPRVRGTSLPKPQALADDDSHPWQQCVAHLYGKTKTVHYKTLCAQWYQVCGARLLRIIVVRVDTGRLRLRVFFCTDPTISIRALLEGYAARWNIEVCFRNLKQLFGFADSSARTKASVEHTAPFVGLMYSLLIVWFFRYAHATRAAAPPERPWYLHKKAVSFADILRCAQRVLAPLQVLDLLKPHKDLRETRRSTARPTRRASRRAPTRRPRIAA